MSRRAAVDSCCEYMDVSQVTGLDPARVALVPVDFQNGFCRGQTANTGTAERAQCFAAEAMMIGVHVVYTRQVLDWGRLTQRQQRRESPDGLCAAGSAGAELLVETLPGAAVVAKGWFDLWRSDQWWQFLSDQHIDGLIISGVELCCCVMYALLGADEHGYAYTVPLDLVSGIDAGEATYNEWTRRYLRDVHDAPESSQERLSAWRDRGRKRRAAVAVATPGTASGSACEEALATRSLALAWKADARAPAAGQLNAIAANAKQAAVRGERARRRLGHRAGSPGRRGPAR